jgi:hypothetical protein
MEPCDAAFRLAIPHLLDEFVNLVPAERIVKDGIALNHRNLNVVASGEEQALPLILSSFFQGQFELGMLGTNELSEFLEGRELFLLR